MESKIKIRLPYEPKVAYRWEIKFSEESGFNPDFVVATDRPRLRRINNNVGFEPISITFIDPVSPSVSQQLTKLIYDDFKFGYILSLVDPVGSVIEKWTITECRITELDFGGLDYSSDDLIKCKMVFIPNNVKLEY